MRAKGEKSGMHPSIGKAFDKAFYRAFEHVSMRIYHDLIKAHIDGLPDDWDSLDLWNTDLISREPSEHELDIASHLALSIEADVSLAIRDLLFFELLNEPGFYAYFAKMVVVNRARSMAEIKKLQRTLPFERVCKATPGKSTKEVLREMEERGEIEDQGDHYLVVIPGVERANWKKLKKTTLDSKLSRLRAAVKNPPGLA